MLDELLKSTPGAQSAPGVDPLSAVASAEPAAPAEPASVPEPAATLSVQDGVPGSAGAVSFVDQLAASVPNPTPVVSAVPNQPTPAPADQPTSLASIPGIVLEGADGSSGNGA